MPHFQNSARYQATEDALYREVWLRALDDGTIYFPASVGDQWAKTLTMAIEWYGTQPLTIVIDTAGGDTYSFEPCKALLRRRDAGLETTCFVSGAAESIGLSYVVVCTKRIAAPDATFMAHGENRPNGPRNESGVYMEDHYTADWMARFTDRNYEWWFEKVLDYKEYRFNAEEALELGVIDEIAEGV